MSVIADTSALIAFCSESGDEHDDVTAWLAARYRTDTILTLEGRYFGALRSLTGEPFVVAPHSP
ncbi:hypothetical protein [Candidatus Poriferisodalis sp.]|uniref:hypothetical protein n=1 Tax=Candidatus Poriferisodalis sp. TaxID=3101277 RepID=UPI003B5BEC3A